MAWGDGQAGGRRDEGAEEERDGETAVVGAKRERPCRKHLSMIHLFVCDIGRGARLQVALPFDVSEREHREQARARWSGERDAAGGPVPRDGAVTETPIGTDRAVITDHGNGVMLPKGDTLLP